jgi:hypothetical protein
MLENLLSFFDRVVVLNLQDRSDRWNRFLRSLPSDWPFRAPLRFPAVRGDVNSTPSWWNESPGAWGCYQSHAQVIRDAIRDNLDSILILEDDAIFREDFAVNLRQFLRELPIDWSMIYLGGEHIQWESGLPERISENVYRPYNVNRTHGYAIRGQEMMKAIAHHLEPAEIEKSTHHIDHHLGEFQKATKSRGIYVPKKWLIGQSGGASDVATWKTSATFFADSYHFVEPTITKHLVFVLSPVFPLSEHGAKIIRSLGIPLKKGDPIQQSNNPRQVVMNDSGSVVDASFEHLALALFDAHTLEPRVATEKRRALIRIWSSVHCSSFDKACEWLCLAHPLLPLVTVDIANVWQHFRVVLVDSKENEALNWICQQRRDWSIDQCVTYVRTMIECCHLAEQLFPRQVICISQSELNDSPKTVAEKIKYQL